MKWGLLQQVSLGPGSCCSRNWTRITWVARWGAGAHVVLLDQHTQTFRSWISWNHRRGEVPVRSYVLYKPSLGVAPHTDGLWSSVQQ